MLSKNRIMRSSKIRWLYCVLLASCVVLAADPRPAAAHNFDITQALMILKQDGTYQIDLRIDVDALALGVSPEIPSEDIADALSALSAADLELAKEQARDTLRRRLRIRFDRTKSTPVIDFPEHASLLSKQDDEPTVLGTTARLVGRIPDDTTYVTFGASRAFKAVQLTILHAASMTGRQQLLSPGSDSTPYALAGDPAPAQSNAVALYLALGFEHILPKGLDHILFVLGLFLLSARIKPLLWQVTAFTIAHSVTLALSMTGVAELPAHVVEPLIALSIAYVAIENLFVRELKPWRPALVFVFGLLHGMGFAGVLQELGMPPGQFTAALLSFNGGVELGQLAVVGLAFLTLGWFRDRPWYRARIVWPLSLAIAGMGLYWAVERTFSG